MHPQIRQQKPGKCPICQMELVPVKPSAGGLRTLTIKPNGQAIDEGRNDAGRTKIRDGRHSDGGQG